jgi:hypothetical protein
MYNGTKEYMKYSVGFWISFLRWDEESETVFYNIFGNINVYKDLSTVQKIYEIPVFV